MKNHYYVSLRNTIYLLVNLFPFNVFLRLLSTTGKRCFLLMHVCVFSFVYTQAQTAGTSVLYRVKNLVNVSSNVFTYDVYMINTGTTDLYLRGYSFGMNYASGMGGSGTLSHTFVSRASNLSSLPAVTPAINLVTNHIRLTTTNATAGLEVLISPGDSVRLATMQVSNTAAFPANFNPQLALQLLTASGKTQCIATCIIAGTSYAINGTSNTAVSGTLQLLSGSVFTPCSFLNPNSVFAASTSGISNVTCFNGSNGTASITLSGAGSTGTGTSGTYNINNGSPIAYTTLPIFISALSAANYTVTVSTSLGCTDTASVVINSPSIALGSSFTTTACDVYTLPWFQSTNTSGTYTHTYTAVAGCDSVVTAHVTINPSTSAAQSVTACAAYTWSTNNQTYTQSGTYTYTGLNAAGCTHIDTLQLSVQVCQTELHLGCFIEGYYDGINGMVPVLYNQAEPTSAGACDTLTVELHSATAPYNMEATATGILQQDGTALFSFPPQSGSKYIVVKHRSALETWSAQPVNMGAVVNYDFRTAAAQAYGSNQKDISGNGTRYALFSGDIIKDGNIDLYDLMEVSDDIVNFVYGYYPTDITGDGNVDLYDLLVPENNVVDFVFVLEPNSASNISSCNPANVFNPSLTYNSVSDQDGNVYKTIQIGNQEWMAENLRVGHYRNGDAIPVEPNNTTWGNLTTGASCWYNNDSASYNCPYGRLYNWFAVADSRNVCPLGWHVPGLSEFNELISVSGGFSNAGINLKSQGLQYWAYSNSPGTNSTGFSALPSGYRLVIGNYGNLGFSSIWWSNADYVYQTAWPFSLSYYNGVVTSDFNPKSSGFSLRCVKDECSTSSTNSVTTCDSYTWNGNNQTYTQSGTYTATNLNALGCTHTQTLNLTINNSTSSSNSITANNSYIWPVNGQTYTQTGTYTATNLSITGCTHTDSLYLTIQSACNSTNIFNPNLTYGSLTDQDGNVYKTIQIGTQEWMAENLRAGHYRNGDAITVEPNNTTWGNLTIGASCWYNNDSASYNCPYGRLYNWYVVADSRNVCPLGWHVPSSSEWNIMEKYFDPTVDTTQLGNSGTDIGNILRSSGIQYWLWPNTGATNNSGFSALPGGGRNLDGTYMNVIGVISHWWSSTEYNSTIARNRSIQNNSNTIMSSGYQKGVGFSIRCIKDDCSTSSNNTATACNNYTWNTNNQTYTQSGTYTATSLNASGCTHTQTLNLTINNSTSSNSSQTACSSYTWVSNGQTYTQSGTYTATSLNALNCLHTDELQLIIGDSVAPTGMALTIGGVNSCVPTQAQADALFDAAYAASAYSDNCSSVTAYFLYSETSGNDNSWQTVYHFTVSDACGNELYNQTYYRLGSGAQSYTDFISAFDSYTWPINNQTYIQSGIYTATNLNTNGCTETHTLNLTITSICMPDQATADAAFDPTLAAASYSANCSGVSVTLVSSNTTGNNCNWTTTYTFNVSDTCGNILTGQTYTRSGGDLTAPAGYQFTIYANSCIPTQSQADSLFDATLAASLYTDNCSSVTAYFLYSETFGNENNWQTVYHFTVSDACGNSLYNQTYSRFGSSGAQSLTDIACDSYIWPANGQTYTQTGTYTATSLNAIGCTQTHTLNLTINNSTSSSSSQTACDSYTWSANGLTYTSGGTYTSNSLNASGCTHTHTLNLTINSSTSSSSSQSACSSYTWISNGQTYTQSGTYTATSLNAMNCLHTDELQLIIGDGVAPTGVAPPPITGVNSCMPNTSNFDPNFAASGYTDNCGSVTAVVTAYSVSGTNCSWTETYIFSVIDNAGNTLPNQVYTRSGGDVTAPSGTAPTAITGVNSCAPAQAQADALFDATLAASGYSDNCSSVTATLVSSNTSGQNCFWTTTYIFSVSDACGNTLANQLYTRSGGDQAASMGTAPAPITSVNSCAPTQAQADAAFNATIAASGYSDNCSGVTANLVSCSTTGTNCSWTTTYTFNVVDACGNMLSNQTYTRSGGDQTAPMGTAPAAITGVNSCAPTQAQADALFDAAYAASAYSDNCSSVSVNFINSVTTGNNSSWQTVYYFTVSDACGNELYNQSYTRSGGDMNGICNPIGVITGTPPPNIVGVNSCTPSFNSVYAASGYNSTCGGIIASLTNTVITGTYCSWSATFYFTVSDACGHTVNNQTYMQSGSDVMAPSGSMPLNINGISSCVPTQAQADALFDAAYAASTYTDNCTSVTASLVNSVTTGNNSGWQTTYYFTISDACGNELYNQAYYRLGSGAQSYTDIISACDSYTWPANGQTYTQSGTYTATNVNPNGCNQTNILNLTINTNTTFSNSVTIYSSYTWAVNGQTYTQSGTYTATSMNTLGCIQTNTLNLIISTTNTYPAGSVFCNGTPTAIIDVTNPLTGKTWMDRNLGAIQAASTSYPNDANAYGDYYQWGRRSDGHQCLSSTTTTTLSSTDQPAHGNFIVTSGSTSDWRSPQNSNLWQGINGVNNPCPSGYRLPTETELNAERLSWSSNNAAGAFASALKLPMAGMRVSSLNGMMDGTGSYGVYWSSTVGSTFSRTLFFLDFLGSYANMFNGGRAEGCSVRCIKDDCSTSSTNTTAACDSYVWSVSNQTYTQSGTYTVTSLNATGCTHTQTLNLTINSNINASISETACDTYTWPVNGLVYTSSGTYTATSLNSSGCIQNNTLYLTINSSTSSSNSQTACPTYTWAVNNQTYTQSGTYTETSMNAAGCIQTNILNLTVNTNTTSSSSQTACTSYTWTNNQIYTQSGIYTETSTNAVGCTQTNILNLTINTTTTSLSSVTAMGSYTWAVNGQTYTQSGTYTATSLNASGCTQTNTLNLNINQSGAAVTFTVNNMSQTSPNSFEFDIWMTNTGTATLKMKSFSFGLNASPNMGTLSLAYVSGSKDAIFNGITSYSPAVTLKGTAPNTFYHLRLVTANVAAGTEPVLVQNVAYRMGRFSVTSTGNYSSNQNPFLPPSGSTAMQLTTLSGYTQCILNALVNGASTTSSLYGTANPLNGTNLNVLTGIVSPSPTGGNPFLLSCTNTSSNSSITTCDTYTWPANGQTYTQTGNYTFTSLIGTGPCVSTQTLSLTINNSTSANTSATACSSYTWPASGQTYTQSGTYTATSLNAAGCTHTQTLNLSINNTISPASATACDSYTWAASGLTYTNTGTYTQTSINAAGCIHSNTLNLTINYNTSLSSSQTACDAYTWVINGFTYTTSGTYTKTSLNTSGCTFTRLLNLTINYSTNSSLSQTACDSYSWNGTTYTTSGVYTYTSLNPSACVNTATLNLTINYSTNSNSSQTACDSYTWPASSLTYTTSGTYTTTNMNSGGCTYTQTLSLTINYSTSASNSITATSSYTWPVNGQTYTQSGTYTATSLNAAGCMQNNTLILMLSSPYPSGSIFCTTIPTAVVDVINPLTGKTWMDRNLGAMQAATSSIDTNAYGDLYQWGRTSDGHQCRTSNITTTLSSSDQPAHGNFISAPNYPADWRSPQNTNLWQGINGVNNPCPSGYRLPTETELEAERLSWSSNTAAGAFDSPLKLPMAGYRGSSDGSLDNVGIIGYYWSSAVSSTNSRSLDFFSSIARMYTYNRAFGGSVRCIKEAPSPIGVINSLDCNSASNTGTLIQGNSASGLSGTISYTGGNSGIYNAQSITSSGVTGLTATFSAGTFANGSGTLTYVLSGTPTSAGTASFAIIIGGQSCNLNLSVSPTTSLTIGQNYQGGIIAYILQAGDPGYDLNVPHGLIAAPSDQSTGIAWYNGPYVTTGATATALGAGNVNTNTIVSVQGNGTYAAKLCYDLVLNGYSDWYLPSKDELNKLYLNKTTIGGFASAYYWSSSENYYDLAWFQHFYNGTQDYYYKYFMRYVRAVRAF